METRVCFVQTVQSLKELARLLQWDEEAEILQELEGHLRETEGKHG